MTYERHNKSSINLVFVDYQHQILLLYTNHGRDLPMIYHKCGYHQSMRTGPNDAMRVVWALGDYYYYSCFYSTNSF